MEREEIIFDKSICTQAKTIEEAKGIILHKWENLKTLQDQGMRIPSFEFDLLEKGLEVLIETDDALELEKLREALDDLMEDAEYKDEA
jgi:hypothetical protein